jgi:hypothetical protein
MKRIFYSVLLLLSTYFFSRDFAHCADQKAEELKAKISQALPFLEGWCSKEKACAFIDLVLQEKPQTCVEIGVFGGKSLLPVAMALKSLGQGIVIGVDPWDKKSNKTLSGGER